MSLRDKLKPRTKEPIGKVAPCLKCGYPDCEHYSANYQKCPRCDGKIKPTFSIPDDSWDFSDTEDTDPGIGPPPAPGQWSPAQIAAGAAWYRCGSCSKSTFANRYDVAAGQHCHCGGALYVLP